MSRILTLGVATLDIINSVDHYPSEDEEIRALSQRISLGGNAANSACILAQFNHAVEFAGVIADEPDGKMIKQELTANHVGVKYCQSIQGKTPTSYITLNEENGSRTIIHYRDLTEFNTAWFRAIPISEFDWLHFEGRNVAEVGKMLASARRHLVDQPISVEIEKERDNIDRLFPLADILLFSRHFALNRGYDSAAAFFDAIHHRCNNAILVCTWGEQGAWARDLDGSLQHSSAFMPPRVVDTLGAGDTFNAGFIHAMASGQPLAEALTQACRLAGNKTGQIGYQNLAHPR